VADHRRNPDQLQPGDGGQEEWDRRYARTEQVWSGRANGALVVEVGAMPAGRALDVGCGEGADAVWLATRGWQVTACDVSQIALDRAEAAAKAAGVTVQWLCSGLLQMSLTPERFDLVSVQYPALLRTADRQAERALIGAVAPGGILLVVHHADVDIDVAKAHGFDPAEYVANEDVVAVLDDRWQIEVDEVRTRGELGGGGGHHHDDLVLRARRLDDSRDAERKPQ
jgi:SAM-dependent methyltransferase